MRRAACEVSAAEFQSRTDDRAPGYVRQSAHPSAGYGSGKHDHVDLVLASGQLLRLTDRRFGAVLWQENGTEHSLLAHLGPEPLSGDFTAGICRPPAKGAEQQSRH